MQKTATARPVPYLRGPAEAAFGLQPVLIDGNTAESAMHLGGWALHEDGSEVHPGATGVLIDDTTAYAALTSRGAEQWGVTSEISVDFHAPIPVDARRLTATATADHSTGGWGHSSGQLRGGNGELIATIGQRMRFFPGDDSPHRQAPVPPDAPSWLTSLDSHLELVGQQGTRSEFLFRADPGMRNPMGMLHGGISLGFSELAARKAWENSEAFPGEPFRTASLRISYLRPGVLGGDLRIIVDVIHSSRSVVLAEVGIRNTDGTAATFGLATLHRVATM
jgi:uncharacterized protein (TIGR00369 family)